MKYIFLLARLGVVVLQRVLYVLTLRQLPPFASTAIVVQRDDKYLMVKRRDGRGYGLPGGYIQLHETVEDAARREAKEETGYDIELLGINKVLSGIRPGTKVRCVDVIYNAAIIGGELKNSAEGEPVWVNVNDVSSEVAFDYLGVLSTEK